jgi:hypothetical protein
LKEQPQPDRVDAARTPSCPQRRPTCSHSSTADEGRRGALTAGRLADLAVLTKDFTTVPAGEIGGIELLLTMVGGRIVYAAGPFATIEE